MGISENANQEERLYAIQNLLCAEEHLIEILIKNSKKEYFVKGTLPTISKKLSKIKKQRQILVNDFFKLETENKKRNKKNKNSTEALWCTLKHILLAQYHNTEVISKEDDYKSLTVLSRTSYGLNEMTNDILELMKTTDLENCNRCDEDRGGGIVKKILNR